MIKIITLKKVTKIYKSSKTKALDNINLEIKEGEFFGLVGYSGSGKSTILKLIAKIEEPTSGEIESPTSIGMVFQLGALFPWLTVEENVMFGIKMKGISESKGKELVKTYLRMVNLENYEKKYPRELSGGQRQRVGIARALVIDPEVLLLDEPFSALDTLTANELYLDLLNIWNKTKKTIVMVSHYLEESIFLADRIGVMNSGKLVGIVDLNLKRPRDNKDREFNLKLKEIKSLMEVSF